MAACKHWDAGWCYEPTQMANNSDNGQCNKQQECLTLLEQINRIPVKTED